ncbi:Zinc finger protein zfp-1 [Parelaphostrongylus tenuis]|uniref:Zinc finger protein zfp-1 n=1 Tax=Parelaphostrongylus tenuis TaxID=148309 RepID=A0AAD5LSL3_PARTN|nr:Zinc finger protein zfp-1 [Parelaphostrongylus tenuis]
MKEMLGGCCVCADENGWTDNPLIYCDGPGCEVAVHQGCYGIQEVPEGEWLCAKCHVSTTTYHDELSHNGTSTNGVGHSIKARCELCPFGYGALKRTEQKGWAHVICALYIPEVRFGDVHSMDPVILSDVPAERFEKLCYICANAGDTRAAQMGACMSCNKPGCKRGFHVTCAQQRGLLCEEGGGSKNVKYCGYCEHHLRRATADPAIKVIPPCRIRAHPSSSQSSVPYAPTPPNSNNSGHMLVDPFPRSERVGAVIGLAQSSEDSHLINNFSPPLTTSSRSSVALDATPPLSSGGGAVLVVKQDHVSLNGPQANTFSALVNAAAAAQAAELTNHNRLGVTASFVSDTNGHHDEKVMVDSFSVSSGALTPTSAKMCAIKRSRDPKTEFTEKTKRPRPNHRTKSEKALRDLVGPIVSETVSDFHRERIADRSLTCDRRMVTTNAVPSTSHDVPLVTQAPIVSAQTTSGGSNIVGTSPLPATTRPQGVVSSTLPSSMEQLLERQWEQGSQFLISHAQFDVAQLLSCLHQLKSENIRLEEQLIQLNRRREHLVALTSRLSVPLSGHLQQQQQQQQQQQLQPTPSINIQAQPSLPAANLVSPHHSPVVSATTSVSGTVSVTPTGVEDSLTQLRSLASGTPRPSARPPSQASHVPSTSSLSTTQSSNAGFVPHVQSRTSVNVCSTPSISVTAPTLVTPSSTTQPPAMTTSSTAPVVSAELAANISPERLAALNPLINSGFLGRSTNQMLNTGNAMDPLITSFLLSQAQHNQQQYLGNSPANILARFMMPPISGSNSVQGNGGIGK